MAAQKVFTWGWVRAGETVAVNIFPYSTNEVVSYSVSPFPPFIPVSPGPVILGDTHVHHRPDGLSRTVFVTNGSSWQEARIDLLEMFESI